MTYPVAHTSISNEPALSLNSFLRKSQDSFNKFFPLNDPGPLAEPWRRLFAATVDMIVLLIAAIFAWLYFIVHNIGADQGHSLFCLVAPFVCWLYVWAGWAYGATPGMLVTNIRIVRDQSADNSQKKPGLVVALVRIVGYWIACIPVKGGLVPILTHQRRQGWHDQIARTVVVKVGKQPQQAILTPIFDAHAESAPIDFKAFRSGWGFALIFYFGLAVVFTYPLIAHFGTHLAGLKGDSSLFVWDYWYVSQAVASHRPFLTTDLLFYPQQVSVIYHTMDWFNGFVAIPLLPRIGTVATYNTLFLMSLTLSAFFTYLLLISLTSNRIASIVIAPIFGLSPFFTTHGLGHANIISAEFFPLFALFSYAAIKTNRLRYSVFAGLCMALGGLCDYQFLIFDSILLLGFLVALCWQPLKKDRTVLKKHVINAAIIFLIGGAVLSPIVLPIITTSHERGFMDKSGEAAAFSADVGSFVSPGFLSTVVRGHDYSEANLLTAPVEKVLTPGLLLSF